jgi:putative ABC transport system ATP-binding protein
VLHVETLTKRYQTPQGTITVLDAVTLSLAAGETMALMGESGVGKSTLLHLVAGLDAADSGTIRVGETVVTDLDDRGRARVRREALGLVFQQFNLIPSLSVADNVSFQARLAGREDAAWSKTLIGRLGLEGLEDRYPEQLSGGQQQRVAIGRALAARPGLILADEPTGALDEATAATVLDLSLELVAETGAALLIATHSEAVAARLQHRRRLRAGRLETPAP